MHLILITTVWGGHTLQVKEGSLGTGRFSRYTQLVMAKLDFKSWKLVPERMFSAATSSPTLSLVRFRVAAVTGPPDRNRSRSLSVNSLGGETSRNLSLKPECSCL